MLISGRAHFNAWNTTRFQERHYVMIKESIHQEDMIIINIYALNNRASEYIKQNQ